MSWQKTDLEGVCIWIPRVFRDDRGYFMESFRADSLQEIGFDGQFVQDNEAYSHHGVLRGLHYQLPPYSQTKLVRVVMGKVLDVVVDIRLDSSTYGEHRSFELSAENKYQLFVSHGFAHGYVCLSEEALFLYKCDRYYHPQAEAGIRWNDPSISIDWKLDIDRLIISDKDNALPHFGEHKSFVEI
jgi:dTDP-4-dehydrorhamnose 3,5-epimerase